MVNDFHTPILLNVFNRPNETAKVLDVLKIQKPPILYVHCDGPREDNDADRENVAKVRHLVEETVTWPCNLHKLYEEKNLGCGRGPAASMSWFFSEVEEGVILEDDCVPHSDFFLYCQELLERYRDDSRMGIISGTCFSALYDKTYSYHFSPYGGIWGWATWRRTWDLFDYGFVVSDKTFRKKVLPFLKSRQATNYWLGVMHQCIQDGDDRSYWDYQLHLSMLYANKIHILPNYNLISNVGFNDAATHTFDTQSRYANKPTSGILPLIHPEMISIDYKMVNRSYNKPFMRRVKSYLKRYVKRAIR